MFRITFVWGGYRIKEYTITDELFETLDVILGTLPGAQILEIV